jgi:FKBP-type peptidyl-prolyl cis-trans isomerase (trigger factor)
MRLITKYNNLQECYHNLQVEFTKSEIEKANLRQLNKDLIKKANDADSGLLYLRNKIIENPEQILHHIKLSKIENYIRKTKLRKISTK